MSVCAAHANFAVIWEIDQELPAMYGHLGLLLCAVERRAVTVTRARWSLGAWLPRDPISPPWLTDA